MAGIRIAEVLQNLARTGRINQGDDVFLQSLQGRIRNNIQFNPAREFVSEQLEQNEKKKKRLLTRADDFNAHFNSKQALQNPKYREVVNVENKNYIDDVEGLKLHMLIIQDYSGQAILYIFQGLVVKVVFLLKSMMYLVIYF